MTEEMTTTDCNIVCSLDRNLTVKFKHLVKLRSFKHQTVDRIMLRAEDSSSPDQLEAFKIPADISCNQENTFNDEVNSANRYQKLPSNSPPGSVNDCCRTQLVLANHAKYICAIDNSHILEATVFHEENKCSFSKNDFPNSEIPQMIPALDSLDWKNHSCSSHRHFTVNNLKVENNFQTTNSNTHRLTGESCDLQLIKRNETDKVVLQNSSPVHTKQITPVAQTQKVTEACQSIFRNFTKGTEQDCSTSGNNVGGFIGDNMRITSTAEAHKESSDLVAPMDAVERITLGLQMLKLELKALRLVDLSLLKQLIAISQAIRLMQTANLMRSSRSMSLVSSTWNPQLRYRTMERQVSAPHTTSCRRNSFAYRRASNEDCLEDSLYSLNAIDSESQDQLNESNSSMSIFDTNSTSSYSSHSKLFDDLTASGDLSENSQEEYEDILRRNIRLWKVGSQNHDLTEEIVLV